MYTDDKINVKSEIDIIKMKKELDEKIEKYEESEFVERLILFIDLADSTEYKNRHPAHEWVLRQATFLKLVTGCFEELIKQEIVFIKYIGDAVFISVRIENEVIDMLESILNKCIIAINSYEILDRLEFHIGIDMGKVKLLDDKTYQDPIGKCVDRAARIASIAGKSQVLISTDAGKIIKSKDKMFLNKGIILKGFDEEIDVYEYRYDTVKRYIHNKEKAPEIFRRKTIYQNIKNPNTTEHFAVALRKRSEISKAPLKIAAFGPHVDDIELGCGGTLARLIDEYDVELFYILLTYGKLDGDGKRYYGQEDRLLDAKKAFCYLVTGTDQLEEAFKSSEVREFELTSPKQKNKSHFIAYGHKHEHSFRDCELDYDEDKKEIRKILRKLQTEDGKLNDVDIVFMPSLKDIHQDHKLIAELALQIFRKQETVLFYKTPDSGKHPNARFNPNFYVDISNTIKSDSIYEYNDIKLHMWELEKKLSKEITYANIKLRLMHYFTSEMDKYWYDDLSFLGSLRENAIDAYLPTSDNKDKFAEGFEVVMRL